MIRKRSRPFIWNIERALSRQVGWKRRLRCKICAAGNLARAAVLLTKRAACHFRIHFGCSIFELHERSFLLEQRLKFINEGESIGKFILEGKEYRKLEDKIFFLIAKCSGRDLKNVKGKNLWQKFEYFKDVRDALVHPRRGKEVNLTKDMVEEFCETSKLVIQLVSKNVWKKDVIF